MSSASTSTPTVQSSSANGAPLTTSGTRTGSGATAAAKTATNANGNSSSNSPSKTPIIVGAVLGVVVAAVVIWLVWFGVRRRRKRIRDEATKPEREHWLPGQPLPGSDQSPGFYSGECHAGVYIEVMLLGSDASFSRVETHNQSSRSTHVICGEGNREELRVTGIAQGCTPDTDCCVNRWLLLRGLSSLEARWISTLFPIVTQQWRYFSFASSCVGTVSRTITQTRVVAQPGDTGDQQSTGSVSPLQPEHVDHGQASIASTSSKWDRDAAEFGSVGRGGREKREPCDELDVVRKWGCRSGWRRGLRCRSRRCVPRQRAAALLAAH